MVRSRGNCRPLSPLDWSLGKFHGRRWFKATTTKNGARDEAYLAELALTPSAGSPI